MRIPQLGELGAPASSPDDTRPRPALNARRSCLTSYPSTVEQGLLWVWADPSTPQEEADKQSKCSLEDFRGEDADAELARRSTTAGWFVRDLPASFEATVENGELNFLCLGHLRDERTSFSWRGLFSEVPGESLPAAALPPVVRSRRRTATPPNAHENTPGVFFGLSRTPPTPQNDEQLWIQPTSRIHTIVCKGTGIPSL